MEGLSLKVSELDVAHQALLLQDQGTRGISERDEKKNCAFLAPEEGGRAGVWAKPTDE